MSGPGVLEADLIARFLFATLNDDATLRTALGVATGETRVAEAPAPETWGSGPFVTFQQQDIRDVRGMGTSRIMADALYQVKVTKATESFTEVSTAAQRVDVLLHGASGSVTGGSILHAMRDGSIRLPETDAEGRQWCHLGGLYRIWAQ